MDQSRTRLAAFDHAAWRAVGTGLVGYAVILVLMFVLLFLVPYLVFVKF